MQVPSMLQGESLKRPIQPWHTAPHNYRMLRSSTGRFWMRKISLCAAAAAMVAIGLGVWNASTGTRVVAPWLVQGIEGIDPHQVMMNSKGLATAELVDYTFVFPWQRGN
jgi:hypothetical protein